MTSKQRSLYGRAELQRLLAPRSVAIVGASTRPGAFSARTLENMAHFRGELFLVNPRYQTLAQRPCHADLRALPQVPDCVVIALPWHAVLDALREAADAGVGGAIVYASGFAETGRADRTALQHAMADIARASGLRILGPNCLGVANNLLGAGLLFQIGYAQLEHANPRVGLVSQSGALGYALLQGARHGMGYTHLLTSGNSCDVDTLDLAHYLVQDPASRAVACVFEAAGDARRLQALAEQAHACGKPVVVCKTAIGEAAVAAAQSHTGSLAGSSQAFDAALRRGGFIAAQSLAELTELADFFAKAPAPQADGVAVMATSGGAAILCADAAAEHDVPLPQPGPAAQQVLDASVPEFGSTRNPCDITGQVLNDPGAFEACARAMLDDPAYGALVLPQVTAGQALAEQRCPMVSQLTRRTGKPVCIVWLSEWLEGPGVDTYARDPRLTVFRDTGRCFKALALWQAWHRRRAGEAASVPDRLIATSDEPAAAPGEAAFDAGRRDLARAWLRKQPQLITEHAAKGLLAQYDIPVVAEASAADVDEAIACAERLGYPVVLKLDVPGVAHKTELGFVRLGLDSAASVAEAAAAMRRSQQQMPSSAAGRFLLQPMLRSDFELMLGMKRDPVFGPLLMVGLGGVWVEVFGDVASELVPVSEMRAEEMLRRLKSYPLLQGYRNRPGVPLAELARLIARFSALCTELADDIDEIDLNPVLAHAGGFVVVDALIVRRDADVAAA